MLCGSSVVTGFDLVWFMSILPCGLCFHYCTYIFIFFPSPTDNFQDQMKRELAYREEMVQQLQIVSLLSLLKNVLSCCFGGFLSAHLESFLCEPCRCTITELLLPFI